MVTSTTPRFVGIARIARIAGLTLALPFAFAATAASATACGGSKSSAEPPKTTSAEPCRQDAADDVAMAGRTGWAGAKTGVKTGVEGVKTFGRSAGGLVEGGKEGAREEWNKGAADTRGVANEGAADTRHQTDLPRCK